MLRFQAALQCLPRPVPRQIHHISPGSYWPATARQVCYAFRATHLPVPKPPANKKEAKELSKKDHLIVLGENEEITNQLIDG